MEIKPTYVDPYMKGGEKYEFKIWGKPAREVSLTIETSINAGMNEQMASLDKIGKLGTNSSSGAE
jgi:DUF1365 family protein